MRSSIQNAANLLSSFEIWIVTAAVVLSIMRPSLLPFAVLVAFLFWPIRWMANGRSSRRTPVDIGVILLFVMIPATLWATALPDISIPQVYRLALGVMFFYSLINWTIDTKRLSWILTGIILVGASLSLLAIFSVQFPTTKFQFIPTSIYQRFELLLTDTVHPNVMAGYILIIIPIGLALLLFAWKNMKIWQITMVSLAIILSISMLILTQSRGALIGLGATLLLMIVLRWRWGWIALPLAGLGLMVVMYQVGVKDVLDFISTGVSVQGLEGRVEIWSRAIYMIQDFSFTGIGMGSYMHVADLLYPFFLAPPGTIYHAHNLFLQVGVDLGIPGLIAWLSIYLGVCICAWQLYKFGKGKRDGWTMGLGAGFLGCQLALIVHGIMDAVTWGMVRPAPLVWALWGAALAAWLVLLVQSQTQDSVTPHQVEP